MPRTGSIYGIPGHELAYDIPNRAAKWAVRELINRDHTGNPYLDKATEKASLGKRQLQKLGNYKA
jgi:hypothetical protein